MVGPSLCSSLLLRGGRGLDFGHLPPFSLSPPFPPGKIEFTWQEVMIGLESSILVFPINLLIVQIFRNTRPRLPREKDEKQKQGPSNLTPSPQPTEEGLLTPETVTKACPQPQFVYDWRDSLSWQ